MREISKFLIIALILYIVWFLTYDLWLGPDGRVDHWLTTNVARQSVLLLKKLGYNIMQVVFEGRSIVKVNNQKVLSIAHACNGLTLHALFIGFILAFPGPLLQKIWYIPVGIVCIYLLNVIRVMSLVVIQLYYPLSLNFNHKYTFVLVVYGCIFGLWMLWVNRFSGINYLKKETVN